MKHHGTWWLAPKKHALQLAVERSLKPGGSLREEIQQLGDYTVQARGDAEAICLALENIAQRVGGTDERFSGLYSVAALFQDVPDARRPAFEVLRKRGCRLHIGIFEKGLREETGDYANDLLCVLNILARYGTRAGTEAIIRAAQAPFEPSGYLWSYLISDCILG